MNNPNYDLMIDSAICALQIAYKDYVKAQMTYLQASSIGSNGELVILGNAEEMKNKIHETFMVYRCCKETLDKVRDLKTVMGENENE